MKEIGGYLGLETGYLKEYYSGCLALNTGRNCLKYILRESDYKTVYVPHYTCNSVKETISEAGLNYQFYKINSDFTPIIGRLKKNEVLLYINYFGICDQQAINIRSTNTIFDNSQSFFSKPIKNRDTFYSCRKFFGVPDGAYLFTNKITDNNLKIDNSEKRISHLIKRIEDGAEKGYPHFLKNELQLREVPIKKMSNLTRHLLQNINYEFVKKRRIENFSYLHSLLGYINELTIDIKSISGPLIYPLLLKNKEIKNILISNKVYIATYWSEVSQNTSKSSYEYYLSKYLIPLPIDQRYGLEEMKFIISLLRKFLRK